MGYGERLDRLISVPYHLQVVQSGGPTTADNQVVENGQAERSDGLDDVLGDGDIFLGRAKVTRGMVVHQNQRRGGRSRRSTSSRAGRRITAEGSHFRLIGLEGDAHLAHFT